MTLISFKIITLIISINYILLTKLKIIIYIVIIIFGILIFGVLISGLWFRDYVFRGFEFRDFDFRDFDFRGFDVRGFDFGILIFGVLIFGILIFGILMYSHERHTCSLSHHYLIDRYYIITNELYKTYLHFFDIYTLFRDFWT